MSATTTTKPSKDEVLAQRATTARKLIATAQRTATRIGSDEAVNRSTRTRNAIKVKADAFDHIAAVMAGKPWPPE